MEYKRSIYASFTCWCFNFCFLEISFTLLLLSYYIRLTLQFLFSPRFLCTIANSFCIIGDTFFRWAPSRCSFKDIFICAWSRPLAIVTSNFFVEICMNCRQVMSMNVFLSRVSLIEFITRTVSLSLLYILVGAFVQIFVHQIEYCRFFNVLSGKIFLVIVSRRDRWPN